MKKLNKEQQQAIAVDEQIVLVKSAVGSGKTTVLTHKICQLCEDGVDPGSIVVLTFTRRAANEIHRRLSQFVVHSQSLEYCGTFHSVANRLLRDYFDISVLGFSRDFSIIEDRQRSEILEELCFDHNIRISKRELRNFPGNQSSDKTKLLQEEYATYKKRNNIVDFDDLMIYLNELLALQPAKFSWIIVDEFQDCDEIQSQILNKFVDHGAQLFAVGDPYQTIYHWRGSNPVIFEDFANLSGAYTTELSLNYRSSANIVEAAKELFAPHNKVRAYREPGTPVTIKKHLDAFHEATYLAFLIKSLAAQEIDYNQIAILYRRQVQREEIVKVFQQHDIPFVIQRQVQLSSIAVLDWLYNLFVLCLNRKNLFAKRMVFSHRKYGAKKEKRAFLKEKIANFSEFAQQYVDEDDIWDYFALHKFLSPTSASFEKDQQLVLTFLREILPDKSRDDFYHVLRQNILCRDYNLETVVDKVDGCRSDGVQLMTLHSSKGLEFSHVFIVGANAGNIPLQRQNLEEEKRLFYVGLTRAKEYVEISYTNSTQLYGATKDPSAFLEELNPSCVHWEETDDTQTDLKELTNMVKESRLQNQTSQREAFHEKYGTGMVVAEDENSFMVDFPGYGEKSFSKVFCPLKFKETDEN
ncbi:ATP-dependent helicase [Candidatus Uabimicrobium amorphum]|uniref:DNA 3'-5' helicase n=1 Tax=Uabimicrobium amorphum TaxID=2596890 RepID=A0A5S9F0L2_UABAM|nr:ATP-dependent helicase [Candidatus Uabimicrobium amorphum]BBM81725.1 ATP-dependent DNA helicase PcrA [Candidatus Uabimicrobium amorphum]